MGRIARPSAAFLLGLPAAMAVPSGFPASGNALWYTTPGNTWSKTWLPIGNGYIAAMLPGGTTQEATQLNIESLWSGGPLQDPTYNGGNKQPNETAAMASATQTIRETIFTSSIGEIDNITILNTDAGAYGSYSAAGYFLSTLNITGSASKYDRWLDLDQGIHYTTWTQNNATYSRETFCSHPTQACVQQLTTSAASLPALTVAWSNYTSPDLLLPQITCLDSKTLRIRGQPSDPGMVYELLLRASASGGSVACAPAPVLSTSTPVAGQAPANATLTVRGARSVALTWVGGTSYDIDAGDAAHGYSFAGPDPHGAVRALLAAATSKSYAAARATHVADVAGVLGAFALDLGQARVPPATTDALVAAYGVDTGNPYLEWLTFNYGRYMLASSARGVLPANLQGKWANGAGAPWSGDYHANINVQMNYWAAELTGLNLVGPLFDYIEKTWAPRGAYTAHVLYNISRGWVTHNEMNIFGHTGMKAYGNSAEWANYPESNVWMMIHVYDHLSFTNDVSWFKKQGWPLIKGVAQFHLDKLIADEYFKDGTLVTVPCNSPEQAPITLGCTHAQTLIWQLFNAVEKGFALSGDTDTAFLAEVRAKRAKMDKGIHIGSWGQLQEWKIEKDSPQDTHRHLSHLIGLYPGYAVADYTPSLQGTNYTQAQVLDAARTSLIHRGNGTGPDADAGWEKVWRAAAWAQFGNASEFYHELTYSLQRDFGPNLFSLYNPFADDPIFQIDANLGYPAALLNALIQSPDTATLSAPLRVALLPALPSAWSTGSFRGARVRGGATVDLAWKSSKPTTATFRADGSAPGASGRKIQFVYGGKIVAELTAGSGQVKKVTF